MDFPTEAHFHSFSASISRMIFYYYNSFLVPAVYRPSSFACSFFFFSEIIFPIKLPRYLYIHAHSGWINTYTHTYTRPIVFTVNIIFYSMATLCMAHELRGCAKYNQFTASTIFYCTLSKQLKKYSMLA